MTLATAVLVLECVLGIYTEVAQGGRPGLVLAPLVPGIALELVVEPLGTLLGTSIRFQLLAVAWTYTYAGTVDFPAGGILSGVPEGVAAVVFCLFAFGIGKAALMLFHRWLPVATRAIPR